MREIGRYGVWVSRRLFPADAGAAAEAVREIEALGYGSLWLGGSPPDDLALPAAILAATSTLVVGTSIVDIWRSDPAALAASHERLRAAYGDRFLLGLGPGHAPAVEATGQRYVRPLSKLRGFLETLNPQVPPAERMIAALGPRALELAAAETAGALPYLVPPAHTAAARAILGPDRALIPEQKVFLGEDPAIACTVARKILANYLVLPNYLNNLRRYGLTDADFADGGTDRLVDELVGWGSGAAVKERLDAHLAAGADHVAVHALSATDPDALPRAEWRSLATTLFA